MNAKRGLVPLALLFLGVLELVEARPESRGLPLFKPTEREGLVTPDVDPTVIRQRKIVVDLNRVRSPQNQRITFPLFDGGAVVLVRNKQETPRANTLVWYGQVEGQPGSTAILSNVREALAGDVMTRDRFGRYRFYQIRYLGNDVHVLNEIDQSKFPPEDPPSEPGVQPVDPGGDPCGGDSGAFIDVLVLYTGTARFGARNADPGMTSSGIEGEIYEAVADANLSYEMSEVSHRLRLVHMEEVVYSEVGKTPTQILAELQGGIGNLAKALTLRDAHSADVVVLITSSLTSCGKTNVMSTVSQSFESEAFAVVRRICSVPNHSFAHEIGHIMGARHQWAHETTPTPPVLYAHAYVQTPTPSVTPWGTIMSVAPGCLLTPPVDCTSRLPHWSNPNVLHPPGGAATGMAGGPKPTDNHRQLNETALTVANFRCASPDVNNVWMKDTVNDTGKEPDPQTAGEDMHKSPAIWVRNSQDTSLAHRYDHENPRAGGENWVYVEMRNDGGQAFGDLELYFAPASTALDWQMGWTQVDTSKKVNFPANSDHVVEIPWTPTQAGHYCLLARWVSPADPMAVPETTQLESNVRNNNNIVWRNLDVIDLSSMATAAASFQVRPVGDDEFSIVIRTERRREGAPPLPDIRLTVEVDDAIFSAWREGGARLRNLRNDGRRFVLAQLGEATIENLRLRPGTAGRVNVTFERRGGRRQPDFVIDVVQVTGRDSTGPTKRPIGGVSYIVRTNRR